MFDDDDEEFDPTEFDPNPWGSRQRLKPRATFIPAPATPSIASVEVAPPPVAAAPPSPVEIPYRPPIASPVPFTLPAPLATLVAPFATPAAITYAASPVAIAFPPPRDARAASAPVISRVTVRVRALPLHPPRRRMRYAIPVFGIAALLCLALAYALKPATIAPEQAASLSMPVVVDALATSSSGVVTETAPAEPVVVVVKAKPRAMAKRRPIKIDASITSSPLGQLRPSRR